MLEIDAPEIRGHFLKLQAQFPTAAPLVPAPNQYRFASVLVRQVDKVQPLTDGKSLLKDREAALRADIYGVAFRSQGPALFCPLDGHSHARIQSNARSNLLHALFVARVLGRYHNRLPEFIGGINDKVGYRMLGDTGSET
jgi:hypothetical protein